MYLPKFLALGVVIFLSITTVKSQTSFYSAAKAGLNIREKPDVNAAVLTKIPYGEKLTRADETDYGNVDTEGMQARWMMVTNGTVKGYVADVYLLPFQPPSADVKSLRNYLGTLSKIQSSWKKMNESKGEDAGGYVEKIIYANGIVLREFQGYEYFSETIWFPKINMQHAFVMARLLCTYPKLLDVQDKFPTESSKGTTPQNRDIKVFKVYENFNYPSLIRIDICDAGCHSIEIHEEEGEVSICFSSGV